MGANSVILWRGRSKITGAPIRLTATGMVTPSDNAKTGDMLQICIMPDRVEPHVAILTGADDAVCGSCPMRPMHQVTYGDESLDTAPCYVRVDRMPLAVWRATKGQRARMQELPGIPIRFGAWGDPAAVPVKVLRDIIERNGYRAWTGYTHRWQSSPHLRWMVMASVDSPEARDRARAKAWRTFRTKRPSDPVLHGETVCPASAESGKRTTCADCLLCDGSRGPTDRRADIVIDLHGARVPQEMRV